MGLHLFTPGFSQGRKHRNRAAVLDVVRKPGSFGYRTESVLILSRHFHVIGIEHEVGGHWRVIANPKKRLDPVISGSRARQFNVRRRRKELPLGNPHSRANGQKQQKPSPTAIPQDELREQPTRKNEQHDIDEMQAAHRL